jgi:CheY-like chemotaxis protein
MKILVIDDEEDVRYIVRMSIGRTAGMQVLEAEQGQEGIELAKQERPDLILLDLMMPGVDGTAVFHALREAPETAAIPVIFLTAAAMNSEIERLEKLGAKGVIRKPFDPLQLEERIREILAR